MDGSVWEHFHVCYMLYDVGCRRSEKRFDPHATPRRTCGHETATQRNALEGGRPKSMEIIMVASYVAEGIIDMFTACVFVCVV